MTSSDFVYCDLHSHLLPGIDDGCQDLNESLECVRSLADAGCRVLSCTPHMGVPQYAENTPRRIGPLVSRLADSVRQASIDIEIVAGGEFRLIEDSIDWWATHGVPVLGESLFVLVDTWEREWLAHHERALEWLQEQGYRPVLAHPERMPLADREWTRVVESVRRSGVLLQGNFKSFGDSGNLTVQTRARHLLDDDAYDLLASDSHGPHSLAARWTGLAWLKDQLDESRLRRLVWDLPSEILASSDSLGRR